MQEVFIALGDLTIAPVLFTLCALEQTVLIHHDIEVSLIVVLNLRTKNQSIRCAFANNGLSESWKLVLIILIQLILMYLETVVYCGQKEAKRR